MQNAEMKIPGWKIIRTIGKGGFGAVYEVEKEGSFGAVTHSALKVISIPETDAEIKAYRDDGYDDVSITALFKSRAEDITAEFELMSKLKGHSNIVSYEDHTVVQHDNDPGYDILIRMELLTPLPEYINQQFRNVQTDSKAVIDLGVDICHALELCSHYHIIHRDIKPQNIFVNETGDFKLGDFGIAKTSDHTTRATKTGTFGYMAPEVYWGRPYNATADIYSLGLVMYWMLNERRGPFLPLPPAVPKPSDNAAALERRMSGEPLPAPKHGSEELQRIVLKACAADPKERYANPTEMKRDLERLSFEAAAEESHVETEQAFSAEDDEKTVGVFRARSTETKQPTGEEEEKTVGVFGTKPIEPKKPEPIRTETPVKAAEKKNPIPVRQDEDDEKTIGVFAARHTQKPESAADEERTVSAARPTQIEPEEAEEETEQAKPEEQESSQRSESAEKSGENRKKSKLWIAIAAAAALIAAVVCLIVSVNRSKTLNVGDSYWFGSYEQDNNPDNGKEAIEWIILAKEDNKILVISKYALDCQPYDDNDSRERVTWIVCNLRYWLNGTFLYDAFDYEEQCRIIRSSVSADKNPSYSTSVGDATTDKIFLLSITEANKYFDSNEARKCVPTDYAIARGVYASQTDTIEDRAACWWWLRTPGRASTYAAGVAASGHVYNDGDVVNLDNMAVRPAMWIDLVS